MDVLLLPEEEVKNLVSMEQAIKVVEEVLKEKAFGRVQMPSKVYLFYDDGDLRIMPCYIKSMKISSVKIVNVHPRNYRKNLPTVMATIMLIDPDTGFPKAIMGGTYLTGLRTGAIGAIAAKYLAKKNSKVISFIGAGVQAKMQLIALSKIIPKIESIKVFDVRIEALASFSDFIEQCMPGKFSLNLTSSIREAVKDADIIVTTTPSRSPIILNEWIREGVHFNCIGADAPGKQELDPAILKRAAKIVVDDIEQAIHAGEINVPISQGIIKREDIYGELGEIVAGLKKGRENDWEITVFTSTGLAIQDAVVAALAYETAIKKGIGIPIKLVI